MARFVSQRGFNFINGINSELVDRVVENSVIVYQITPDETTVNLYGEAIGKDYSVGTQLYALIDASPVATAHEGFGFDVGQNITFNFHRDTLSSLSLYPEIGNIIYWNDSYYEIDNVIDNTRFGGKVEFKVAVICETHMTRRSRLNIEQRVI